MPQSKTKPTITRSKREKIVRIPYNVQQIEVDMNGETELIYTYNEYRYPDDGHTLDDTAYWKQIVLTILNRAVQNYIYARYDIGTQASFQSIYTQPSTPQGVRAQLDILFVWIATIMAYYYAIKANIRDAEEGWEEVTWDFITFDATDPDVSLENYMG